MRIVETFHSIAQQTFFFVFGIKFNRFSSVVLDDEKVLVYTHSKAGSFGILIDPVNEEVYLLSSTSNPTSSQVDSLTFKQAKEGPLEPLLRFVIDNFILFPLYS